MVLLLSRIEVVMNMQERNRTDYVSASPEQHCQWSPEMLHSDWSMDLMLNCDWSTMTTTAPGVHIYLPEVHSWQKYVNIYNFMTSNVGQTKPFI